MLTDDAVMEHVPVLMLVHFVESVGFQLGLYMTGNDKFVRVDDLWYRNVLSSHDGALIDWFANAEDKPFYYDRRTSRWVQMGGDAYKTFDEMTARVWPIMPTVTVNHSVRDGRVTLKSKHPLRIVTGVRAILTNPGDIVAITTEVLGNDDA